MVGSDGSNGMASPSPSPQQHQQQTPESSPKQYGITNPLYHARPSKADKLRTKELEKEDSRIYESPKEVAKREEVLARLKQIVKGWVKDITRLRGYTDQMVEDANSFIYFWFLPTRGLLCAALYFGRYQDVAELQPVPNAHVPVMKFKSDGISIDLLYASIDRLVVLDDLDISNVTFLHNVDEAIGRSLNRCRVADHELKLQCVSQYFESYDGAVLIW